MSTERTIHLVRHGRVANPSNVIYGRMPGFNLSEVGLEQARRAAQHLKGRDISAVWASPLERAQETAAEIGSVAGVDVVTDERLIESETNLEGVGRTLIAFARDPRVWWKLRNPIKPSWGESYQEIRARMRSAIEDALQKHPTGELVFVSHQSPVRETVRELSGRQRPTFSGLSTPCHTGSVTTLKLVEGRATEVSYFRPAP